MSDSAPDVSTVYLVASGDLRESANRQCEAEQQEMERQLIDVCRDLGAAVAPPPSGRSCTPCSKACRATR